MGGWALFGLKKGYTVYRYQNVAGPFKGPRRFWFRAGGCVMGDCTKLEHRGEGLHVCLREGPTASCNIWLTFIRHVHTCEFPELWLPVGEAIEQGCSYSRAVNHSLVRDLKTTPPSKNWQHT